MRYILLQEGDTLTIQLSPKGQKPNKITVEGPQILDMSTIVNCINGAPVNFKEQWV